MTNVAHGRRGPVAAAANNPGTAGGLVAGAGIRPGADRHGHRDAPHDEVVEQFVALSAALTGFDAAELRGTGMVEEYLAFVTRAVGSRLVGDLLTAWADLVKEHGKATPPTAALRRVLLAPPTIGPVTRNIVVLWYLGEWNQLPADWRDRYGADAVDQSGVVSPEAYVQGLAWVAIGTHPQGAKMPGYGSWALPPKTLP
jgi:hypothetical protein